MFGVDMLGKTVNAELEFNGLPDGTPKDPGTDNPREGVGETFGCIPA